MRKPQIPHSTEIGYKKKNMHSFQNSFLVKIFADFQKRNNCDFRYILLLKKNVYFEKSDPDFKNESIN